MNFKEAIDYLLDEFHLGDKYEDVKERQDSSGRPEGESWIDHPDSKRFAEALKVVTGWRDALDKIDRGLLMFKGSPVVTDVPTRLVLTPKGPVITPAEDEPAGDVPQLLERVIALEAWISRHIRDLHKLPNVANIVNFGPPPLASETQCSEVRSGELPIRSDSASMTWFQMCQLESGHDGTHEFGVRE